MGCLQLQVSLQLYCENSVTDDVLGIFKFFQNSYFPKLWATASDFTRNYCCLCIPCSISFKKYVHLIIFAHIFWHPVMKGSLMILKSQNFDFRIMLSHEINLTNTWGNVLKDVSIWLNLS